VGPFAAGFVLGVIIALLAVWWPGRNRNEEEDR